MIDEILGDHAYPAWPPPAHTAEPRGTTVRPMLRRTSALVACLALLSSACAASDVDAEVAEPIAQAAGATVERVIDGDSLELRLDGAVVEARLIGVNAPELADCQGPAARDALERVVDGQAVAVSDFGSDRFDRLLVELSIGDESVNEALVRAGWALGLHGDERDWTAEMEAAAEAGLGMWDAPDLCAPPAESLVIADVEPDPAGPDDEVLEDEWVEIENPGTEPVELTGWALRDESTTNRFVFETGVLQPGERLRLRTGCGTDGGGDVFWCSSSGVWSNRGETVLLLAPSGAIVDRLFL